MIVERVMMRQHEMSLYSVRSSSFFYGKQRTFMWYGNWNYVLRLSLILKIILMLLASFPFLFLKFWKEEWKFYKILIWKNNTPNSQINFSYFSGTVWFVLTYKIKLMASIMFLCIYGCNKKLGWITKYSYCLFDPLTLPFFSQKLSCFISLIQISLGYFVSDLAMILWNYPALGGMEYVSILTRTG